MYVRACADDVCASVGIQIHYFLVARVITRAMASNLYTFYSELITACYLPIEHHDGMHHRGAA